jgi:hypothetical protein
LNSRLVTEGRDLRWTRRGFVGAAGAALAAAFVPRGLAASLRTQAPSRGWAPGGGYLSRPDLRPPPVVVTTPANGTAAGYVFLAPFDIHNTTGSGPGQYGPLVVDNEGEPVWYLPVQGKTAMDLRVQRYRGRPVLTWYEGDVLGGYGGTFGVYDRTYHQIARVAAGNGMHGDLHEFLITSRNTALISIYQQVTADLSSVGGPVAGQVVAGVVQELDIPTGKVLFQWRSTDHVPVAESFMTQATPAGNVDYFHLNSIGVDLDGDLLVSGRNTGAVYKVDRRSGSVKWRLGGKRSDFGFGPGAAFSYQHDVRRHADGTLTVFDNGAFLPGAGGAVEPFSRPIRLALDLSSMTATLVGEYLPAGARSAWAMGNLQQLPGGGAFVGWGTAGSFSEFTVLGDVCFDASFGDGSVTYRAFRFPWVGRPTGRPAVAVLANGDGTASVHASWNGATEVASWQVRTGRTAASLTPQKTAPRSGFETAIVVAAASGYVAAAALDTSGRVLGTSEAVRV